MEDCKGDVMNKTIKTDYNDLFLFSKNLTKFKDEISNTMNCLLKETENITSFSWKGKRAEEFLNIIYETKKDMDKNLNVLDDLSKAIYEKGNILKETNQNSFGKTI